jgi:hypothetical protein
VLSLEAPTQASGTLTPAWALHSTDASIGERGQGCLRAWLTSAFVYNLLFIGVTHWEVSSASIMCSTEHPNMT